jgi:hypothetical protein
MARIGFEGQKIVVIHSRFGNINFPCQLSSCVGSYGNIFTTEVGTALSMQYVTI